MKLVTAKCHEQATRKTMTSNKKQFTVNHEKLTAVARDQSVQLVEGGLILSLESQRVFQNLLLFGFAIQQIT